MSPKADKPTYFVKIGLQGPADLLVTIIRNRDHRLAGDWYCDGMDMAVNVPADEEPDATLFYYGTAPAPAIVAEQAVQTLRARHGNDLCVDATWGQSLNA